MLDETRHERARLTALESAMCQKVVTRTSEWQTLRDERDTGISLMVEMGTWQEMLQLRLL